MVCRSEWTAYAAMPLGALSRLIDVLRERLSLPVVGVDERLASQKQMPSSEAERTPRKAGTLDELAAAIILQQYLVPPHLHNSL